MDLNKVMIIGRLGADPEVRSFADGGQVANFSVATSDKWTDKNSGDKKERTEWHKISFFGPQAKICADYLHKGSQVYIEGRLQTRKWQDKQGNDRYTTEIVGQSLIMLGKVSDSPPAASTSSAKKGVTPPKERESLREEFDDDIPF